MTKNKEMVFGYDLEAFLRYGLAMPIKLDIASHCHALITGSSGSGKSQALLFLIAKLLQVYFDIVLYVLDFKNSEDFSFLKGYAHYYAGDDCYSGVMEYYARFSEARKSGKSDRRFLLIFDEYPAYISYALGKDKREKTKLTNDVLGAISEILMLGRGTGCGFGFWIVTQRADSTLFSNGARDNFMAVCALGNLSKEQKNMVFPGQEIPDRVFHAGEGTLLANGKKIMSVKYPLIENDAEWKQHILDILMENCSAENDG